MCPLSRDLDIRSPILVVADTHLGLRRKYPRFSLGSWLNIESWSESTRLSDFLEWVRELPPKNAEPQRLQLGPWGKDSTELKLFRPGTLVLLGDFLELWDASDVAVEFASREIWRTLREIGDLGVRIVYVTGNHDFAIGKELGQQDRPPRKGRKMPPPSRNFPMGKSQVEIVEDSYPVMDETTCDLPGARVGETRYVFLHGHQFDTLFMKIRGWRIMSYIRDGAEAFRLYSWIILLLTTLWSVYGLVSLVFDWTAVASNWFLWTPLILLSILGAIPRLVLSIGRPIFNKSQTTRYNPRKALAGFPVWSKNAFPAWWKREQAPNEKIIVVYGHTHLADIFTKKDINEFPKQERLKIF